MYADSMGCLPWTLILYILYLIGICVELLLVRDYNDNFCFLSGTVHVVLNITF